MEGKKDSPQVIRTKKIEEADPKQEAETILKRRKIEGSLLFSMVAGSHAYNLQRDEGSDLDYLAVYCAPPTQFWGLHQPPERVTSKQGQIPDIQVIEAASFCNGLLNANPSFVEMLWSEHTSWWEKAEDSPQFQEKQQRWREGKDVEGSWDYLRANRRRFLTKELVKQYLGFARGQLKLVETKPETNKKKIYNALRLLLEAKRVIKGEEPLVWVTGEQRDFLMSVRREEKDLQEYIEKGKALIKEIEQEEPWPKLKECTEEEWLNDWLLTLRKSDMREQGSMRDRLVRNRSDSFLNFETFG